MFLSLKDQGIKEPEQRSDEWFSRRREIRDRRGFTGSKLSNFLFCPSYDEARGECWGWIKKEFTEEQRGWLKWGQEKEPVAVEAFLKKFPTYILLEAPMMYHKGVDWAASSPDGFFCEMDGERVLSYGIVEIKCPAKSKRCKSKPIWYYIPQMYWECACSGDFKLMLFICWAPDGMRAWKLSWRPSMWNALGNLLHHMRLFPDPGESTKQAQETYLHLQSDLKRECEICVEEAVELGT
jgi:hypothetical protein